MKSVAADLATLDEALDTLSRIVGESRGGRLETLSLVLGHTSIRTTFDLYGHLDTQDVLADLAVIEGRA